MIRGTGDLLNLSVWNFWNGQLICASCQESQETSQEVDNSSLPVPVFVPSGFLSGFLSLPVPVFDL